MITSPGIADAMRSVMELMSTLPVTNGDGDSTTPYVRVWNNQLREARDGKIEGFRYPVLLLEIVNDVRYQVIGQGFRDADVAFRVHIIHEYYNDAEGVTYAQDLKVFEIRDALIALLTYFTPEGSGPLTAVNEGQDYDHDNLYHYIVDFVANFTDSKGSRLADGRTVYINKTPPTALEVQGQIDQDGGGQLTEQGFNIPKPTNHGTHGR